MSILEPGSALEHVVRNDQAERIDSLEKWRLACIDVSEFCCEEIAPEQCRNWRIATDAISHTSGRFFSVTGIEVSEGKAFSPQPVILQPEIGILGFLFAYREDGLQILVQSKIEPGNVGVAQYAPTVQATLSNYQQVHGGRPTAFLQYFLRPEAMNAVVLCDQLQSEQGTRFLGKYNRNMAVLVCGALPDIEAECWRWVPVTEFLNLLEQDFKINTDARSVLLCSAGALLEIDSGNGLDKREFTARRNPDGTEQELASAMKQLEGARKRCGWTARAVPLSSLANWQWQGNRLASSDNADFEVSLWRVQALGREVSTWCQPLLSGNREQSCILMCKYHADGPRFLLRARPEIGYREKCQLGPSLQVSRLDKLELHELDHSLLAAANSGRTLVSSRQSDEGGRFYHSIVHYQVVVVDSDTELPPSDVTCWAGLPTILRLLGIEGALTSEVRSCLSLLLPQLWRTPELSR